MERLLATCLGLPHGQRSGGRSATDLQKQVLITIRILGNPECLRSVAARFNITKLILFRVYRRICGAIANNLSGQYMKNLLVWNWAPLGKMINIGSFAQRNTVGSMIQWSVFRSRRSVIRWILVQSGFDRSLIWKWICSKGTPQIRKRDPDSPKGTHPKYFGLKWVLKKLKTSYCKTRIYAMNIKVTSPLIPTHNFRKKFFIT